jgi:hypothetical protein
MYFGRGSLALGLALALVVPAAAAAPKVKPSAPKVKKQHHGHVVHGVVVAVDHDGNHGTITIKPHHHHRHHKKSTTARAAATRKHHHEELVKVHVTQQTRFELVEHGQGGVHHQPATFAAVKKGEHVAAHVGEHHHAKKVEIFTGRRHKPKSLQPTIKPARPIKPAKKK